MDNIPSYTLPPDQQPNPYQGGVLPYGANPPPYANHSGPPMMDHPMMNHPMMDHPMMNQPMMNQPMMNQPMMVSPHSPMHPMMNQPMSPNQPVIMMGQPMHPMMPTPMIVVQQPQQQQPIIVVQQAPPPQVPPGPPSYDATRQPEPTPVVVEPPPPTTTDTKTYVLAEDKTKTAPTTTTTFDPSKGGQYIGVPHRTYPSVECTFGRWLMWDAAVRGWFAFMPSNLEPKGCCDAVGRCFGWMLWALLLPFTIIIVVIMAVIGLFGDIMVFFAWLFTFGFCCKRCKSKCTVVQQPPHGWFQSCCALMTCTCC